MEKNLSVYELIREYQRHNPNGHYFDHDTLKFFGERISEMRVLKGTFTITDLSGTPHECYMLSSLQRKNPAGPKRHYEYFDVNTFDSVYRGLKDNVQ